MPEAGKIPHRQAINDARARARRSGETEARWKLRYVSVLTGLGLSCILLGGVTGVYLARGGLAGNSAGPRVTIPLIEADGAGPSVANGGTARMALGVEIPLELAAPAPVEPPETDRRQVLAPTTSGALTDDALADDALADDALADNALADNARADLALADGALTASFPPGEDDSLAEATEAALARLYEEPLESAAGPSVRAADTADLGALQQAALAVPFLPDLDAPSRPAWRRFAVPAANPGTRPMIAVVIDDLGLNRLGTLRAIALPAPLTLSFMTYAEGLERMAADARAAGHELLLHVPMAPRDPSYDPGRNVLSTELPAEELMRRLEWGLGRFAGFVGVNNHMGSRFTTSPGGMAQVMRVLKGRGLLFLDSLTAPSSVGMAMARRAGVPHARRDVFLDNAWNDRAAIARQLAELEAVALREGSAVGIGHPHRATLDVLTRWLPEARARGFAIVPISAIVRHRLGIGQQFVETTG